MFLQRGTLWNENNKLCQTGTSVPNFEQIGVLSLKISKCSALATMSDAIEQYSMQVLLFYVPPTRVSQIYLNCM